MPAGIYHYTNAGATTWYHFAREIHRLGLLNGLLDRDCTINPLATAEYPTKAARPAYSVLSKEKIQALGVRVPGWEESLVGFLEDLSRYHDDMCDLAMMAAYDLQTAHAMMDAGRYLYVSYSCQQAVEKNLKVIGFLFQKQRRIHNLLELADGLALSLSTDDQGVLKVLTDHYLKGRYPRDIKALLAWMDKDRAAHLIERTEYLCGMIRKHPIFSIL